MKRALLIAALTLAAAAPASLGLVGNASFGRDVPVRVPTSAILLDNHGGELQPTMKQVVRSATTTPRHLAKNTVIVAPTRATANHSATSIGSTPAPTTTTMAAEPGDDNGGITSRATPRVEPGDDNGPRTTATARVEPGDDNDGDSNSSSASTGDDGRNGGSGTHGGKG
jgi:hypothetical protein